jgi:hypothetical protein
MADPTFFDIKGILDWLINKSNWDNLHTIHGVHFNWQTKQDLLDSYVQLDPAQCTPDVDCFRLIQPDKIGVGRSAETYLMIALSNSSGVGGNGRMPFGRNRDGQYATALQLETIARWIDLGCP